MFRGARGDITEKLLEALACFDKGQRLKVAVSQSAKAARTAIEGAEREKRRAARRGAIDVPADLPAAQHAGYRADVEEAAERGAGKGKPEHQPTCVVDAARTAAEAQEELSGLSGQLTGADVAVADAEERRVLGLRRSRLDVAAVRKKLVTLRRVKHVAIAGEVLLGFAAVAAYVGILDVRSVADVTPGEWFEVVLLALPVVAALVMVSLGLAWWLKKKDITKPTGVHAVALLGVLMVLVGCLTALRLVAATPSEELGGAASAIGALALTILSAAGSVATAVAVAVASLLGEPLQKALDDHMALVRNLDEDVEEARKGQAKPHARAKELRDAAERPSRWMLAFASSVKACAMRMRDDEEQVKLIGEAAEALSARILELSKPSREDLVATLEEYEVVSRDDVRRSNGAGKGIVAGLAIMAASQLTACSPSPPTNAIFVCDATGKPPACTPAVRRAFGERWARTAFDRPGSSIRVVITADSFEATRSVVVATSPPHGKGDRRVARERFARETGEAAENLDVPGDGEGKVNRSNLPAALAAATLLAREMDAPPALMVATDGMVVVERDNGERDPTAYERLAGHLDDMGIEIDMGRFASVTACGFRREGLPPRLVAARDRFWATLLGHLPSDPVPPSSCTGLFGATKRGARGTP